MNEKLNDKEFVFWMAVFTILPWLFIFFRSNFSMLAMVPALVSFLIVYFVASRKYYWTTKLFVIANYITILGLFFLFSPCNVPDMESRGWCGALLLPLLFITWGPIIILGPTVIAFGVGGLIDRRQRKFKQIEFQNEEKK